MAYLWVDRTKALQQGNESMFGEVYINRVNLDNKSVELVQLYLGMKSEPIIPLTVRLSNDRYTVTAVSSPSALTRREKFWQS